MAKLSYKTIVNNMIESKIDSFVWEKGEAIADIETISIIAEDCETMIFHADVKVKYNEYSIHGGINEYGNVWIASVTYSGMRCTEKDEKGEWITESAKPFHEFVHGDALKQFVFN